jgi:hypothetical protein
VKEKTKRSWTPSRIELPPKARLLYNEKDQLVGVELVEEMPVEEAKKIYPDAFKQGKEE